MNKDKKEKAKEEKENHPLKHKLKIWLIIFLCLVMVLLTATYITYLITHKDNNRNPNTYNENSNVSLIEKNMIDAFSNTKDTGKFSFTLSDQDINQMLKNASNNVLPSNAESIYYESKDNHHYFYIDLKPKLFVNTRVVIDTSIEGVTNENLVVLQINNVTMGKLPYLNQSKYLNEDFFNTLSEYSLLPITCNGSMKRIFTSPLELMSYFPNGEYMGILKELINSKPEVIRPTGTSLFGFNIDFSSFRSGDVNPNRSEEVMNLKERVESNITESFLDSMYSGESKVGCSFTLGELNRLIYNHVNVLQSKTYEYALTENKCVLGITDVFGYVESGNFIYRVVLSINGYEIGFDIKSNIVDELSDLIFKLETGTKVECGGCEFSLEDPLSICIRSYLEDVLNDFGNQYDFIKYESDNKSLTFDFRYMKSKAPSYSYFMKNIKVNYLEPVTFEFVFTKI